MVGNPHRLSLGDQVADGEHQSAVVNHCREIPPMLKQLLERVCLFVEDKLHTLRPHGAYGVYHIRIYKARQVPPIHRPQIHA